MLGKPRIGLNNLKTSLRFPCLGLNPIIDSIIILKNQKNLDPFYRIGLEFGIVLEGGKNLRRMNADQPQD